MDTIGIVRHNKSLQLTLPSERTLRFPVGHCILLSNLATPCGGQLSYVVLPRYRYSMLVRTHSTEGSPLAVMKGCHLALLAIALLQCSCAGIRPAGVGQVGKFEVQRDLFLAHFDLKTDVDDLHSVAGVATMLADPRLAEVQYHAVAGAYGTQEGLYVPADELFGLAFGEHWSDAHGNFDAALSEVSALVTDVLASGGTVWIADGGQSDFSAAVVRAVQEGHRDLDTKRLIHIVQHADWNEEVTAPENLTFVKEAAMYHRIPDGNAPGNGTPGFRSDDAIDWRAYVENPRLVNLWELSYRHREHLQRRGRPLPEHLYPEGWLGFFRRI